MPYTKQEILPFSLPVFSEICVDLKVRDRRGRDCMVVELRTPYATSDYHL